MKKLNEMQTMRINGGTVESVNSDPWKGDWTAWCLHLDSVIDNPYPGAQLAFWTSVGYGPDYAHCTDDLDL